jgi:type I restriction enzyme, S subunit
VSELPSSWVKTDLDDVCSLIRGITFPSSAKELDSTSSNVCCLRTSNIQREVAWDDIYFVPKKHVKRDDQFVQSGDILMSMANSYELVGKVAVAKVVPYKTAFGAFLAAIRPRLGVHGQYLFHLLRTAQVQSELRSGSSQTVNIANISVKSLSAIQIPLAPFKEQKRVSSKLDNLLTRIDTCCAKLDRVPLILKHFRQSVLAAACSGELTVDWRKKNQLKEGGDLPEGWISTSLGELLSFLTSGSRGWAQYYSKSGSIFIRAQNINSDFLDLSDIAYVSLPDKAEGQRTQVQKDDLLITITGANVTKSARVLDELNNAYVSQHVALARLKDTRQSPYVFMCLLSTAHGRAQLLEAAYGAGKPGLNLSNIRAVNILLPPQPEQQEIVRRVEKLLAFVDRLGARYSAARKRVDQLTPSLLAKAFRGELVPQDPSDEPAAKLLERIRATKIVSAPGRCAQAPRAAGTAKEPVCREPIAQLPLVAEPASVSISNIPQVILATMNPGSQYTRADILDATGIKESDWLWAIKQLRNEKKVAQVGEKRGAKYHKQA